MTDTLTRAERRAIAKQEREAQEAALIADRRADLAAVTSKPGRSMELIPMRSIRIDRAYQRPLNASWVNALVKTFDAKKVGELEVNIRPDGSIYLIDGQHRFEALRRTVENPNTEYIRCITNRLPQEAEPDLYLARNYFIRKTAKAETWEARIMAGDPTVLAIKDAADAAGFRLINKPQAHLNVGELSTASIENIRAKSTMESLVDLLDVLRQTYGTKYAMPARFVTGLSQFMGRFRDDPNYDRRKLIATLNATTPDALLFQANGAKTMLSITNSTGIALAIHRAYNHSKQYKLAAYTL